MMLVVKLLMKKLQSMLKKCSEKHERVKGGRRKVLVPLGRRRMYHGGIKTGGSCE